MKRERNRDVSLMEIFKNLLIFIILGLFFGGITWYVLVLKKNNENINSSLIKLQTISDLKKNQLDSYIQDTMSETEEIASLSGVKEILKRPTVNDKRSIKLIIDKASLIIKNEVENYIKNNPNKSLDDLKNDPVFKKIAMQKIGISGYSALEDYGKRTLIFHPDPNFVGKSYDSRNTDLADYIKLYRYSKKQKDVFGYYKFRETDGRIREKYARLTYLNIKTADNQELILSTTGYVDDYVVAENVFDENSGYLFEKNIIKNDFYNIFLVNKDGFVVYSSDLGDILGENLNWNEYDETDEAKLFWKVKAIKKTTMSSLHNENHKNNFYPFFSISTPVYENEELIGYVFLEKNMSYVFEIMQNIDDLGDTGETYLVEKDGLLISPLRFRNLDVLVQKIDTENMRNCFDNKDNALKVLNSYDNRKKVATHLLVPIVSWCLITEISEDEVIDKSFLTENIIVVSIFLFFIFLGIFHNKLLRIIKKTNWGKFIFQLKASSIILFSFIFTFWLIFGFSITTWPANLLNKTAIFLTATASLVLFFYGFKLKNKDKSWILLGSFFIFFKKILQISLIKWSLFSDFESVYSWTPLVVLGFVGCILIFLGARGEVKND